MVEFPAGLLAEKCPPCLRTRVYHVSGPYTPAIALTGYGVAAQAQKAKDAGFDRHLSKPVQYEELVENIESLCSAMLAGA